MAGHPALRAAREAVDLVLTGHEPYPALAVDRHWTLIAANRAVSVAMAEQVAEVFTEVIVAPSYDEGAIEVLQGKKNLRILVCEPTDNGGIEMRPISGGLLMQQRDAVDAPGDDPSTWTLATGQAASPAQLADLAFAWRACRSARCRPR